MMRIDYTRYQPGVALAANVILGECPRCGKSGQLRVLAGQRAEVVHEVGLQRKAGPMPFGLDRWFRPKPHRVRTKVVPVRVCKFKSSEWVALDPAKRERADGIKVFLARESA